MSQTRVSSFVFAVLACLTLLPPCPTAEAWPSDPLVNVPLCQAPGLQLYPEIVTDGSDGAVVAWMDYRNGVADIYAQRISANGTVQWTEGGVALCTAAFTQMNHQVAPDNAGGAIVAWEDGRTGYDVYAQRISADGVVQWAVDGLDLCIADGSHRYPVLIEDGAGGAIVAWHDYRNGNWDLYAQRISAGGSLMWTPDGVAICTATRTQSIGAIVSDGAGGAVIAWDDNRGDALDIYAQRISAGGAVQWRTNGVPLCIATNGQLTPVAAPDGTGGAIVAWRDWRSDPGDIYAQRISGEGVIQWTANGVALCTSANDQYALAIAVPEEPPSGAIVTWTDHRSGGDDVYAQRISVSGKTEWAVDGVALCTATGTQTSPEIVPDHSGGTIVSWVDFRGGAADIYAQRVDVGGAAQWTPDGVPVCTALEAQLNLALLSVGAGGAIVTWGDSRTPGDDIYAQRVLANGQLGGPTSVPGGATLELALKPVRPNPARGGALTVQFSLASSTAASLELLDVAGRRLVAREVGSLGAGWHTVGLDTGRDLAPGLYLVCLRQGPDARVARLAVLR